MISGNMVGSYSQIGKTFILMDENGNELVGVVTDSAKVFDATDNDVRDGKIYVSDSGVSIGTKDIPAYITTKASTYIFPGDQFSISLSDRNRYDYTKIQGIIAKYNTSLIDSVYTDKIIINDSVYAVNSLEPIANISKNHDTKSIDFNITNDTEDIYIIHYFTYKEEY